MDENTELAFHDDRGNGSLLAVVDEATAGLIAGRRATPAGPRKPRRSWWSGRRNS
ncbi:hypothetical protein ACFVXE_28750 [Streptomyces sp. NPDC058231]|uniref:hypothetical protein n=1 Tax=Streptomyces sp. NPDC058231 TaxID=3346392 RepID=UPI0036EE71E0